MVVIQYVMDASTMTANVAASRPAFSQSALHSLAGRNCAITINNCMVITTNTSPNLWRMARIDFTGIQLTNRGQLVSSGSTTHDESSQAYGFVFQTQNNYNATSQGSLGTFYSQPVTFTACMTFGNILGITVLPYDTKSGGTPPVAWNTFITHLCITIDIVPID